MSFRYTNNLVGALKHRLMLESSHRDLVRRRFAGRCSGVEVVCSGYGTVLEVRLVDKETWEPFYRKSRTTTTSSIIEGSSGVSASSCGATGKEMGPLDLQKLSRSIKAALWDATRKIRAAKEAALHRSLSHNQQLQAQAGLKYWYEEDANTLRPFAFEALMHEQATPWMQLVRFGKHQQAAALLQRVSGANATEGPGDPPTNVVNRGKEEKEDGGPCVTALDVQDVDPASTPIGSVHPLFVPALVQLESRSSGGSVNDNMLRQEQWRELSRDEQLFWERVELIRKGQLATIKGDHKRDYADQAAFATDNAEEKVQLRFTQ